MSSRTRRGLLVAAAHVLVVASLGGKLLADRYTRPRVWARAAPVDPNLPIRGRYLSLEVEATIGEGLVLPSPENRRLPNGVVWSVWAQSVPVTLSVRDAHLVADPPAGSSPASSGVYSRVRVWNSERVAVLEPPLAYFIPEHAADPSRRPAGEELWVEVTIPRRGAPRPIRLGVKKNGILTPLDLR
jgi:hypothetical protein